MINELKRREQQSERFTPLRRVFQNDFKGGLDYIDVPTVTHHGLQLQRIFDRESVHHHILENNKARFEQTAKTPFRAPTEYYTWG